MLLDFDFEAPLAAKEAKHEEDVRRITGDSRRDARYDCSSGTSQERTCSAPHLLPHLARVPVFSARVSPHHSNPPLYISTGSIAKPRTLVLSLDISHLPHSVARRRGALVSDPCTRVHSSHLHDLSSSSDGLPSFPPSLTLCVLRVPTGMARSCAVTGFEASA